MAMTGSGLSTAIQSALEGVQAGVILDDKYIDAISEAIITYIQTNGQVSGDTTGTEFAQTITTLSTAIL